ncbi:MAG: hypothetical protein U0411_06375 [Thermodesulfovibrionales bacterium]
MVAGKAQQRTPAGGGGSAMDAEITVIGAGVVGLAVAAALADGKSALYILEKNESHGEDQLTEQRGDPRGALLSSAR